MFNAPPIKFHIKGSEYTPTWPIGDPQPTPDDYANFQRSGYRGNSLIFSCIRMKATSYAGIPFVLTDGENMRDQHNVLDLLEAPSVDVDGDEFRQMLETVKDATGNVYIRKVRQSRDFPDRRAWPVKELKIIRSDYIEIAPGRTRSDDMFVVKIDGQIKDRIPRQDMIHIKEYDPSNDFYGLSKIAVCMREGDLDQRMTDFERQFFLNAGVPMGIFKSKSPVNADDKAAIKSAFRRAVQGVGKWFDLLVINSQEGDYQQLGIPQSDMEGEKTRELVESRICAVFGVPAIIVGAKVGLVHAADRANYQTGLRQFWTETMIPDAKMIAGALTRELFAEFRTTADAGWKISHDFTNVEALQSDNSAKLTAAAALMREIGSVVAVNEVLLLAGLPAVEGGEQVITKPEPAPFQPIPAKWRVIEERKELPRVSWVDRHIAQRMEIIGHAERDLAAFLTEQAERVAGTLEPVKVLEIPPEDEVLMFLSIERYLKEAIESGWTLASLEMSIETAFDFEDVGVKRLLEDAGESIRNITQTTRQAVQNAFVQAQAEGLTVKETADLIRGLSEFSPSRAETIARTEISAAQNRAATLRWKRSGLVREVIVFDGIDFDAPCAEANGQTWTLDEFDARPYEHPRCIRTATPVRIEDE